MADKSKTAVISMAFKDNVELMLGKWLTKVKQQSLVWPSRTMWS